MTPYTWRSNDLNTYGLTISCPMYVFILSAQIPGNTKAYPSLASSKPCPLSLVDFEC